MPPNAKASNNDNKRMKQASVSPTDHGGGKRRSGHEALFLLFEEFFIELS